MVYDYSAGTIARVLRNQRMDIMAGHVLNDIDLESLREKARERTVKAQSIILTGPLRYSMT